MNDHSLQPTATVCRASGAPARRRLSGGFTLVELLVTITVIMILAGIVLGALGAARETAKQARTKAIIAKLDHVIMNKYQSYLTRRVGINTSDLLPTDPQYTRKVAQRRLDAIRDLMRMEMPERWSDVGVGPVTAIPRPAVSYVYDNLRQAAVAAHGDAKVGENSHAECLYMLVTHGCPEGRESFNESEIGDTDGDGLPEFIDAWGRPIYFLRWAPAFAPLSDIQTGNAAADHDPFDTRRLPSENGSFKLIPLIYSAGKDGKYDINAGQNVSFAPGIRPCLDSPYAPVGTKEGNGYRDNIHNHHLE